MTPLAMIRTLVLSQGKEKEGVGVFKEQINWSSLISIIDPHDWQVVDYECRLLRRWRSCNTSY
jgi:hypothetical protein